MEKTEKEAYKISEQEKIPLAYHEMCMTREARKMFWIIVGWSVSLIAAIGIFAYMWLQYDYTSTETYTGIYNLVDSRGNVISSDIKPEDMNKILELLNNGEGEDNALSDAG